MFGYKFTGIKLNRQESFLVNAFVLFTFWSFFTGFPIAFNAFFRTALGGRIGVLLLILQLIIFLYYGVTSPKVYSKKNINYALSFDAVLIFIWFLKLLTVYEFSNDLLYPLFSVTFLILLRDDLKICVFDRFVRILAVFLFFSLIEYFIYIIFHSGVRILSGLERYGIDYEIDMLYKVYDQYILNLFFMGQDFPRFQSLCEEPGVIGTICGFLIFLTKNDKRYRWQYYIFIVAGIFSFSLAFFALFVLHFLMNTEKFSKSYILLAILVLAAFFYFYEFFEYRLLFRLQEGNMNRSSMDFDTTFNNALRNGALWLPHSLPEGSTGAGAKIWIWNNGLISFVFLFVLYYRYYFKKVKIYMASKWSCVLFFVAFWLSFYQRHWITNLEYILPLLIAPILFRTANLSRYQ